jgi:hypothetical protein
MRTVWAIVAAMGLVCLASRPAAAAGQASMARNLVADAEHTDAESGDGFYEGQFVYSPPPTPILVNDPKFYREGFFYTALDSALAPPYVPTAAAKATAPPTPWVTPFRSVTPPPTATPLPVATPLPAKPISPPTVLAATQPPPTPTPFILGSDQPPLFHEGQFVFGATPTPVKPFVPVTPSAATPTPLPTPTFQLIMVTPAPGELDIEDPRFYRGSFRFAPVGAAQGSMVIGGAPSAPGYAGASYETLSPAYSASSPLPVSGKAMYYNPGIMQAVYSYRLRLGQIQPCGECVGFVALLRSGDLGRRVWLRWADGTVEGPFLVIDVAARHHIKLLLSRGWAVDVDYATALRRGMFGPVPVTILAAP